MKTSKNLIGKIAIIGNSTDRKSSFPTDGGRLKVLRFKSALVREGFDVTIVDLENWKAHPFLLIFRIYKALRENISILIMGGPKGCRTLIPLVNFLNRPTKRRVVFCPLGLGTIDQTVAQLSNDRMTDFLKNQRFGGLSDPKMAIQLKKLDKIIPQNDLLTKTYESFYGISNCQTIFNFRLTETATQQIIDDLEKIPLKLLFISRVNTEKGIFDLLDAVKEVNAKFPFPIFSLDIYGEIQLTPEESTQFSEKLNAEIHYEGLLKNEDVYKTICAHYMVVLPTKYYGEGTPGIIVESLICGVPVIASSFSQVSAVIDDDKDGFIFALGKKEDLKKTLLYVYEHRDQYSIWKGFSLLAGHKYSYEYNRLPFLKAIFGDQIDVK